MTNKQKAICPCGSNKKYADCCGRYLDNAKIAPTAEVLMRSRYVAYALERADYLLATWHRSTRPVLLDLKTEPSTQWLGLEVKRHELNSQEPDRAVVEFEARYKDGGRSHFMHEVSRFVREEGQWFYVDGDVS